MTEILLEPVKRLEIPRPPTGWLVVLKDDGIYPCGMICRSVLDEFPETPLTSCGLVKRSRSNEQVLGRFGLKDISDSKASRANWRVGPHCTVFSSRKE